MALEFTAYDVTDLTTIAHLFPASRGRRGIYRLQFADGARYVGRTIDVVRRFGAHRTHHPDIVTLEFARATARVDLAALEVAEIRAEQARGARLSNVVHGSADSLADADLDTIVSVADQEAWLYDGAAPEDIPQRTAFDAGRVAQGRSRFRALLDHPSGPFAIEVARIYVATTVVSPRATEGTFWVATAMATTGASSSWRRLVAISVNKMETLVLGCDPSEPEVMWGFLNVRRSALLDCYGSMSTFTRPRRSWLEVEDAPYESAGGDGLRLHGVRSDFTERLFLDDDNAGILGAGAALNLMLMRKGPSLQWRYHSVQLGERLIESLSAD